MNKIKYIAAVLIAIAGLGLQQAKADFIFNLTVGNSGLSGFPGPYATVDVHLVDPTHATISFTLTNTSGTWASDTTVLVANAQGAFAAAHIFVTTSPANASNSALVTGFAANGGSTVPDGGTTVMLLGAALGALGMARRFIM